MYIKLFPYYERRVRTTPEAQDTRAPVGQNSLHANNYTPRRPRTARLGRSLRNTTAHRTADEILGLARGNIPENGSLDAEIQSYLGEPASTLSSLVYWQVSIIFVMFKCGHWPRHKHIACNFECIISMTVV